MNETISSTNFNNKRILKNTIFLYVRMILVMLITLYMSRIILRVLGVEDFGIYNVVAGFVSMFAFLTATVSGGTSRFFAYEIGQQNWDKLSKYFRLSIVAFAALSLIILLLAETVGLWFVTSKLVIPENRMWAAVVVYQCSILSFIANMFSIPYKSMVIANEKMDIYAYISILEVSINLGIAYIIGIVSIDKLELYGILILVLNTMVTISFYLYCRTKYKEARFTFFWDKSMFIEFFNYSIWIVVGSLSGLLRGQGLNILLNIFFGPTVNAARGIAYQIHSAVNQFVNNFYTACRPQITKLYATKEYGLMMSLVFTSSRICYMLTLFLTLPIFIETPAILGLWLGKIPDYTILFTRLVLVTILIETISYPFQAAISATGRIKWYQIITGGITVLTLPIAYIYLKLGYEPEAVFYVSIGMAVVAQLSRVLFMKYMMKMSVRAYIIQVIMPMMVVSIISPITPMALFYLLEEAMASFLVIVLVSFISVAVCGFILGLSSEEKRTVFLKLKKITISK